MPAITMKNNVDLREFLVEIKALEEDGTFSGVASVLGAEDLGGDIIERGAFTKTLAENPEVPILWQHDPREVIGRGNVRESGKKIIVQGSFDLEDAVAMKAYRKLKSKLINGLSIGFSAVEWAWEEMGGKTIRRIKQLRLWEISVVTFPMNELARVTSVKSDETELAQTISELSNRISRLENDVQPSQAVRDTVPPAQETPPPSHTGPAEPDDRPGEAHLASEEILKFRDLLKEKKNDS